MVFYFLKIFDVVCMDVTKRLFDRALAAAVASNKVTAALFGSILSG